MKFKEKHLIGGIIAIGLFVTVSSFTFKYHDHDDLLIADNFNPVGSYALVGEFPHWCIANIQKCTHGFTLDFWVKIKEREGDSKELVLLTNGGKTFYSEGFYIRQLYGDQYEIGVTKNNRRWKQKFRLVSGYYIHIVTSWNDDAGLKTYIDELEITENNHENCLQVDDSFDPFRKFVTGLDEYGDPFQNEALFEIRSIEFFDRVITKDEIIFDEKIAFKGCYNSPVVLQSTTLNNTSTGENVRECRKTCTSDAEPMLSLMQQNKCSCVKEYDIKHKISNTPCMDDEWQVYLASSTTKLSPYYIDVTVQNLTMRNYLKPMESLRIDIDTNLSDSVEFEINMDDGVKITTLERQVFHYWYQEGNYTVTVKARLGSITVTGKTRIIVKDVIEGIPPELAYIASHHITSDRNGNFELSLASDYRTECYIDFGDDSLPVTSLVNSPSSFVIKQDWNHTFPEIGLYNISVNCTNKYGTIETKTAFLSKRFDVVFEYFEIGQSFLTEYSPGFDYLTEIDIMQNGLTSLSFDENNGHVTVPLNRPYESLLSFNAGPEITQQRIFYVQSKLDKPMIEVIEASSAWVLTTNITIGIPAGYQTFVNCTFGLNTDKMIFVYESNMTVYVDFTITYPNIGYYDVVVNTTNDISFNSNSQLISVEVPIISINIETEQVIDNNLPVTLNISLNMNGYGPQKVKFRIEHGDGNTKDYDYFSSTDYFTPYRNEYVYSDWGMYRICVTAINEISNVTDCVTVQVGQNMTYNDIQTDTDARASTTEYAEFTVISISGSDRTYTVDFGDEYPFTFTDNQLEHGEIQSNAITENTNSSSQNTNDDTVSPGDVDDTVTVTSNVETSSNIRRRRSTGEIISLSSARRLASDKILVKHMYSETGLFEVQLKIQNSFSFETKTLCPKVIVDDTDISSCQRPLVNFNGIDISKPYERVRSEQIDIEIMATSSCSDVFSYSWQTKRLLNGYYKTFDTICTTDADNDTLQIPPVSLQFGKYKISMTVSPVGYPCASTVKEIDLFIIPSHPVAHIEGDDDMWFLSFGSTTIDFRQSRDPDLIKNNRKGLEYDLFCMPKDAYSSVENDDLSQLRQKSIFMTEDTLFGGKTKNPARFYDYATCLDPASAENATRDISLSGGMFEMPSRLFSSDSPTKQFVLYVTKEGRTSKTSRQIELRISNSSDAFSELDALLAKKDVAGVLAAVNILSSGIEADDNSTAAEEAATQMKEALVNYVEAVSDKVQNVGQCKMATNAVTGLTTGTISMKTRSKGSNAIAKTASSMSSKFADESMGTLTDVASVGLQGISNVLPKETADDTEKARKRKLRQQKLEAETNGLSVKSHCVTAEKPTTDSPIDTNGVTTDDDGGSEEDEEDYTKLLKKYDVKNSKELLFFYDCLYDFPVAFRGAVRTYGELMWFPLSILDVENEEIFAKYSVEWEPFDVDEYINTYCRKEIQRLEREKLDADRDVADASMNAIGDVSNLMLGKMEGARRRRRRREAIANGTAVPDDDDDDDDGEDVDQALSLKADSVAVEMKNIDPSEGEQTMGTDTGGAKLDPGLFGSISEGDGCSVGATVVVNDDNPFTFSNSSDSSVKTRVVSIDLSNPCTGQKAQVQNTSKPIIVEMDGNPDKIDCPAEFILCLSRQTSGQDPTEFNYHPIPVATNDSTIHFTLWPDREGDRFKVFIKYEEYPNATYYDHSAIIPHDKDAFKHIDEVAFPEKRRYLQHTYFPPQNLTRLNGTYRIAIKLHEKTTVNFEETKVCLNYTTQLMIGGCKYWSEEEQKYKGDGLEVSNETTIWKTKCLSNHLTSFGGDFAVPPNTIDFNNVWAKFDLNNNAGVFSTVIALIGIYTIVVIWGRYMDKKDLIKWGATPLEDNLPTDNYHYQLTIQTGIRKRAGTSSKISLVLSGENNDSGSRRLYDGHRKVLETGSILNYILSVEQCLGPLSFLRIWHDNSGKGKDRSWFLDQVQVSDLQTGERYFFLCDRWFAVEEDDGMIDRIIPVAGREDLAAFKHLFSSSIRKKLTSDHLWFSVFSRPTRSNFTRVQRISCCMSLLFMTMITNAMWFKSEDNAQQTNSLQIGPISFTLQQVFISFASTMLVFPVNFIIITFFRRCRPKKNTVTHVHQQMPKRGKWKNATSSSQIWGNAPKKSTWQKFKDSVDNITSFHQRSKYNAYDIDPEEDEKPKPKIVGLPEEKQVKKKKKPGTFPPWCIYIAYVLTVMSIIVPGFFTILYSMEWGPEKANEWLVTFLMSFFQSVIIVQPVKVMCLVAFIACVLKKPDIEEEDGAGEDINNVIAAHDEEMLHKDHQELDAIVERRKKANADCKPMDMETLHKAREARLMEIKMETVLREIAIYLVFVLVLFFLSYQQRDSNSFVMAKNLKSFFGNGFTNIKTTEQYWKWMETKLLPAMYASKYDNGTEIKKWWDKRCIADLVSRRVGLPRLRQLRVKPDTCTVNPKLASIINHCRDEYGWTDDDAKHYLPGWAKPHEDNITMLRETDSPWVYRSSVELANAPYVGEISTYKGGGYLGVFERNVERTKELLNKLRKNVWLDVETRAVFLEFTVYNPNLNLFGSMIMLVEFMSSGGAVSRMEFKIFRLLSYIGGMGILVIIFEALYACFTLYFFVHFVNKVKKEKRKYFSSFWNKLEFVLMIFCVSVIAMYALKHILTSVAMDALKDRDRADNVNFQALAQYDELYSYMVGIVVFLATIQFLKLLQFNKKMNMLGDTIALAAKDLKVFSFAFIIYFLAFTIFGFLLFGSTLYAFSGFISAAESMFAFTLGSFDFAAMEGSQKILGPIFFFLFIFIVYVGLMSIFLTIIADAFSTVKENVANQTNDYEIVDFLWKKIKGVVG